MQEQIVKLAEIMPVYLDQYDGNVYLHLVDLCRVVNTPINQAVGWFSNMGHKAHTLLGRQAFLADHALDFWVAEATDSDNELAQNLLISIGLVSGGLAVEAATDTSGEEDVMTPVGLIDYLSISHMTIVEEAIDWKRGVGRLMVLKHYYPSHSPRLVLLGTAHTDIVRLIQSHCDRLGIQLQWENQA